MDGSKKRVVKAGLQADQNEINRWIDLTEDLQG
jgi:hypothetical protein